jgi:hypothetical protein
MDSRLRGNDKASAGMTRVGAGIAKEGSRINANGGANAVNAKPANIFNGHFRIAFFAVFAASGGSFAAVFAFASPALTVKG